jgi:hypothetical protein
MNRLHFYFQPRYYGILPHNTNNMPNQNIQAVLSGSDPGVEIERFYYSGTIIMENERAP